MVSDRNDLMLFLTYFSIGCSLAVNIGGCDSDIVVTILSQCLSSEGYVSLCDSQISVFQCNGLSSVNIHKSQLNMTHWSRLSIIINGNLLLIPFPTVLMQRSNHSGILLTYIKIIDTITVSLEIQVHLGT